MTAAARTLRTLPELIEAGLLPTGAAAALDAVVARYAVAVTPAMAAVIDRAAAADPIALQFVPSAAEIELAPGEHPDPIGDATHSPVPGIVHRHADRVLLKLTAACPVYCRFCFRREAVGPGSPPMRDTDLDAAIAYIAGRPQIWEVILTGGDPLILSPRRIGEVTQRLAAIGHVKVLRWHTRVPVVDPERITPALATAMSTPDATVYVGIHANHPREITPAARAACGHLAAAGIALVSQTVLLRGVNDDADTLAALMRAFVEMRVRPYYLHQLDRAPGTARFRVPVAEGRALMRALRSRLSGLAQPTYVLDIPGGHGKVPIGPAYLDADAGRVTDFSGTTHDWADRG